MAGMLMPGKSAAARTTRSMRTTLTRRMRPLPPTMPPTTASFHRSPQPPRCPLLRRRICSLPRTTRRISPDPRPSAGAASAPAGLPQFAQFVSARPKKHVPSSRCCRTCSTSPTIRSAKRVRCRPPSSSPAQLPPLRFPLRRRSRPARHPAHRPPPRPGHVR
jgi:hypothetical protein